MNMDRKDPVTVRQKRARTILICQKCLKRSASGKSLKRAFKARLRDLASAAGHKKPRLVMTSCIGICPKRAIVVTNGGYLARGEYLLMDERSVESAASLLLASGPQAIAS